MRHQKVQVYVMGLMRNIIVSEYRSEWPDMFLNEAEQIREALNDVLIEIHHIGSTAVPGLAAKPVIDMLVIVRGLKELDFYNEAMVELKYEPKGELGIPKRRFFSKGLDDNRTHHVHAFKNNNPEIKKHIKFRDFLRSHPDTANRYAELKKKLSHTYKNNIDAYIAGKSSFIEEALEREC